MCVTSQSGICPIISGLGWGLHPFQTGKYLKLELVSENPS